MGRRPRKNIIWSREAISIMGLMTSNMANMAKLGVLSQNENFKVAHGGCARSKKFLLGIQLLRYLGDPFAKKKEFWGPPLRPATLFYAKTSLEKMDTYKQNIRILGAQRLRRISSCGVLSCVWYFCANLSIWKNNFRESGHNRLETQIEELFFLKNI